MQIRSEVEFTAALAELNGLDVTKKGVEARLAELNEAIDAWTCATGSTFSRTSVGAGDRVQLAYAFLDNSGAGFYDVVRELPSAIDGEAQYRVVGSDGRQRNIGASQIRQKRSNLPTL